MKIRVHYILYRYKCERKIKLIPNEFIEKKTNVHCD